MSVYAPTFGPFFTRFAVVVRSPFGRGRGVQGPGISMSGVMTALLFLLVTCLNAQAEEVFSYGYSPTTGRYAPKPVKGYKYEVTKAVFRNLDRARGEKGKTSPKLLMNSGKRYIAWMSPAEAAVGVEERAYDLCTQFGADSLNVLATLLAHEMIHYYEKHDWSRHFVRDNSELDASKKIGALQEGIKLETQADYLGGILAISAGYDAYHLMPEFLRRCYAAYRLPEQLKGYPSLAERVQLARNTAQKLKGFHMAYQNANLLTLIDAYEPALKYYELILRDYASYEIYNNAGVTATLASLDLMQPADFPYALPLELDPSSRLDALATRAPDDAEARRAELLSTARQYLEGAIEVTDRDPAAYLNLAALALVEGNLDEATFRASQGLRIAKKSKQRKSEGDALVLQGIVAAVDGDPAEADRLFRKAQPLSPQLATANLEQLKDKSPDGLRPASTAVARDRIAALSLDDYLNAPQVDTQFVLFNTISCGRKDYDHSQIAIHFVDDGREYAFFQTTKPAYDGTTKAGIGHGASIDQVKALYSEPSKVLALRTGTCLRYDDSKLLFFFDEQSRLVKWAVYRAEIATLN